MHFHYPHSRRVIVGYHGCDKRTAIAVLGKGGELVASENRYDWLGKGIYFWEEGFQRAKEFAEEQKARNRVTEPFVIGAYLDLGHCFDLTDTRATGQLNRFYKDLKRQLDKVGTPMPTNDRANDGDDDLLLRKRDCAVINSGLLALEQVGEPYQSVRGMFQEGKPAFPGAAIREKSHVQLAIRDPKCILGYFQPAGYAIFDGE